MNKTKNRRRRGFTLIEMIVVIAIIAVLIALVAPLMTRYITNAKELRYQAAAKELYTAGQAYVAEVMLNGCADCKDAVDDKRYGVNELTIFGNGFFWMSSSMESQGDIYLGDYLDKEISCDQWFVHVKNFEILGATVFVGSETYAYPDDFDWRDGFA